MFSFKGAPTVHLPISLQTLHFSHKHSLLNNYVWIFQPLLQPWIYSKERNRQKFLPQKLTFLWR